MAAYELPRSTTEAMNMLKMRDVMTSKLITVGKNDDLKHVMELMEKNNITKVPVLDNGQLVGIVTDNLIAKKLGSLRKRGQQPSGLHASSVMEKDFIVVHPEAPLAELLPEVGKPGITMVPVMKGHELVGVHTKADLLPFVTSDRPVREIMRTQLKSVSPSERIVHARRLLVDNDIARLPVLENGQLVGIIHEAEIAKAFSQLLQQIPFEHQQERARHLTVGDYMRTDVVTAHAGITCKQAARQMMETHVGALPLVNGDNRIVGWVTRTDLVKTIPMNGASV